MSAIVLFCSIGMNTWAAESQERNSKIKVYDSRGDLLIEFDSLEEYNEYYNSESKQRLAAEITIAKFIYDVAVGVTATFVVMGITNIYTYLSEYNITIPTIEPGEVVIITSLDGNIYNPYPPNSYQAIYWERTNFRVTVSAG